MRRRSWFAVLGVVAMVIGVGAGVMPAAAQPAQHRIYVRYYSSKTTTHAKEYAAQQTLEDVVGLVNGILNPSILPRDVEVAVEDCGMENALYDPATKRISFCYEMLDFLLATSKKVTGDLGQSFYQMAHFILLHEIGHMFQDLLKRGGLGNRESEADYFAAIVAISAGERGAAMAAAGSFLFMTHAKGQKLRFNDEHPPSAERAFDIMCLVYGSKPAAYSALGDQLGKDRRQRCAAEYQPTFQAWKQHLKPVLVGGSSRR